MRLDDSGIYRLTVLTSAGHQFSGETSLQVERISNGRPTGPEESLIEGESSANISSEGTGSISSVQWMKDHSNSIIFSSDNRSVSISPVQRISPVQCRQWRISVYININVLAMSYVFKVFPVLSSSSANVTVGLLFPVSVIVGGGGGGAGLTSGAIAGIVIGVLVAVDLNYADISHFQKAGGERVILGNMSEPSKEYAEVKHGEKSRAPPPPYGSQVSNPPPVRR
uniref:Uncharacterized protein n=1 Tax=Sinocyclocheilus grahami TaxID=75366 RepID=A0A672PWG8_SINGR